MNKTTKRILIVILSILSVPFLFVVGLLLVLSPLFINEARLQIIAIQSKNGLEHIEILKGRTAPVRSQPNGDGLTGSDSPASERFVVDDTVENLHRQVTESLSSQGFKVSDSFSWTGSGRNGNTAVSQLNSYAERGKESMLLRYRFAEEFSCYGACPRGVVITSSLSNRKATELIVNYSTGAKSYRDYGSE